MSMISEQIDELEMAKHSVLDRDTIDKLLNDAITTIKELSAKVASESMERSSRYYNGGWIPCEEQLPKYNENVLVCTECDDVMSGRYCDDETWETIYAEIDIHERVIAWQPLPNPYKEENE